MIVTSLAADGFKNLEEVLINPHPKLNLITGMNAAGQNKSDRGDLAYDRLPQLQRL